MKKLFFLTSLLCFPPVLSMTSPYGTLINKDGKLIHAGLIEKEKEKKDALEEMIRVAIVNDKVEWLEELDRDTSHHNIERSRFRQFLTNPDKQGATTILLACQLGRDKIVEYILRNYKTEAQRKFLIKAPNGDEVPCTPLHMAAAKGHDQIVKLLLRAGADKDSQYAPKQRSPLHYAVANEHVQVVKLLREAGAYLLNIDVDKNTPVSLAAQREYDYAITEALNIKSDLIFAAMNGRTSDLSDFIAIKANLEVAHEQRGTPLIIATTFGHTNAVKILLNARANIEAVDPVYRATPLMWAANGGYTEVVKLLLDAGSNIHAKNKDGLTALDCARKNIHFDVVEILEEALKKASEADDQSKEDNNNNASPASKEKDKPYDLTQEILPDCDLLLAAQNGLLPTIERLTASKKNLEMVDEKYAATPLIWAANNGQLSAVKLLLIANANIRAKNKEGDTALDCARKMNQPEIVAILEEALKKASEADDQINIAEKDAHDLLLAAQSGAKLTIERLISIKANLEVVDKDKATPLILAAYNGKTDAVKLLLNAGANIHSRDADGFTALDWAECIGFHEIRAILQDALKKYSVVDNKVTLDNDNNASSSPDVNEEPFPACDLLLAAENGWNPIIERLIASKKNLEIVDKIYAATPLIWAANNGQFSTVKLLLDAKANIHAKNKEGDTALDCARKNIHFDVVEILEETLKKSSAFDDKGKEELT